MLAPFKRSQSTLLKVKVRSNKKGEMSCQYLELIQVSLAAWLQYFSLFFVLFVRTTVRTPSLPLTWEERLTWKVDTQDLGERLKMEWVHKVHKASIYTEHIEETCFYQPAHWLSDSHQSYRQTSLHATSSPFAFICLWE